MGRGAAHQVIRFGVIGCGLMGREFASAIARWCHLADAELPRPELVAVCDANPQLLDWYRRHFASATGRWRHLLDLDFEPQIVAACDTNLAALEWFSSNIPGLELASTQIAQVLEAPQVEALYVALPHHLHQQVYIDAICAGKHLLGEKPFGIDQAANDAILQAVQAHPEVLVRCSSEFPFIPGPYRIGQWIREGRFGQIIEVEAGFWHSSDLDPNKPINWKRVVAANGEYGCLGDLGMHVVHMPFRFGWFPRRVFASLSKVVRERPDKTGKRVPCETWDNAVLACEVQQGEGEFPMFLSTKRIAPGHANTWFIKVYGTALSAEFTTKSPKQLAYLPYTPGGAQEWHVLDMPHLPPYPVITGGIFEFGFSDAILQMFAAFLDELVHGREGMRQPFTCATPQETALSHRLFTAALESHRRNRVMEMI